MQLLADKTRGLASPRRPCAGGATDGLPNCRTFQGWPPPTSRRWCVRTVLLTEKRWVTGTDPHTVIKLPVMVGRKCEEYMERTFRNLHVGDVQLDEIWQFVYCKQFTAKKEKCVGGCGDSYCYTAIERNTKLLICWHMGRRNERTGYPCLLPEAGRIDNRQVSPKHGRLGTVSVRHYDAPAEPR
jgi:hypothetical protein